STIHPVEHRPVRADRSEPSVIGQQQLVELGDAVTDVLQTFLVCPDVEPAVRPHQDIVRHSLEQRSPRVIELAVNDCQDVRSIITHSLECVLDEFLDSTTTVVYDVDDQSTSVAREYRRSPSIRHMCFTLTGSAVTSRISNPAGEARRSGRIEPSLSVPVQAP